MGTSSFQFLCRSCIATTCVCLLSRPAGRQSGRASIDPHDGDDEEEAVYYRGVCVSGGRITAQIRVQGQKHHIGLFKSREEAARAYDDAATRTCAHPVLTFNADGSLNEHRWGHSRYEGVTYHRRLRRFYAQISIYGVKCYIRYADSEEQAYEAYCHVREVWAKYRIDEMVDSLRERNDGEVLIRAMMRGAHKTTRLKPTIESHCEALSDLLGVAIQRGEMTNREP